MHNLKSVTASGERRRPHTLDLYCNATFQKIFLTRPYAIRLHVARSPHGIRRLYDYIIIINYIYITFSSIIL